MPKKRSSPAQPIIDEIDDLFGDTSVSKEQTLEWMEEILQAVQDNVSALREDLRKEED